MNNWKILDIFNDPVTGYLGVLYYNETDSHLVLAHRSTNFKLSLDKKYLLEESGVQ